MSCFLVDCLFIRADLVKGWYAIASSAKAVNAEARIKPYWDATFHFTAIFSMISHTLRCLNNLFAIALQILCCPRLIFTPWNFLLLPFVLVEHALAATLSLVALVITPLFFILRTLPTIIFGYQKGCEFSFGSSEVEEDAYSDDATTILIPSP